MEVINSHSAYLNVTEALLTDISSAENVHWFPLSAASKTYEKIKKRVGQEGLSFITKTLPRFGKALDRALSGAQVMSVPGFKTLPDSNLPKFLGEFTSRVFNNDGRLKPCPCTKSVEMIRLVTSLFYKLEQTYEKHQEDECVAGFKAVDDSLPEPHVQHTYCPNCIAAAESLRLQPNHGAVGSTCASIKVQRISGHQGPTGCVRTSSCSPITDYRTTWRNIHCFVRCYQQHDQPHGWCAGSVTVNGSRSCYLFDERRAWFLESDAFRPGGRLLGGPGHIGSDSEISTGCNKPDGDARKSHNVTREAESCSCDQTQGANCSGSERGQARSRTQGSESCLGWRRLGEVGGVTTSSLTSDSDIEGLSFTLTHRELLIQTRRLLERLLCNFNPYDIRPAHGPGAVAEGLTRAERRHLRIHIPKLDAVYPYDQYNYWSPSHLSDELSSNSKGEIQGILGLTTVEYPTARVLCVPKDSRGPRVIAAEPYMNMRVQQGIRVSLQDYIQEHSLTRGFVSFTDQSINGNLAKEGSHPHGPATLDLKEASDRLSMLFVQLVWPCALVRVLEAVRSTHAELPNGSVIRLKKHAAMGSSMCFVVMAVSIWAVGTACLMVKYGTKDPNKIGGRIFVYGDDVITPEVDAIDVMAALEAVGLVVNRDKSYPTGLFKESCGEDWFAGHRVNGLRIRTPWSSRMGASHYTSWIDYSNQFHARGCVRTAGVIAEMLERMYGSIPRYPGKDPKRFRFPAFCHDAARASDWKGPRRRWNKNLQKFEFYVRVSKPVTYEAPKVGWCDMLDTAIGDKSSPWWQDRKWERVENIHLIPFIKVYGLSIGSGASADVGGPCKENTWNPLRRFAVHNASSLARAWRSDETGV